MTLTIELPNDFIEHYETDKFKDSLMRINSDIRTEGGLCGQYEYELVDALIKAFKGSNAGAESARGTMNCKEVKIGNQVGML